MIRNLCKIKMKKSLIRDKKVIKISKVKKIKRKKSNVMKKREMKM